MKLLENVFYVKEEHERKTATSIELYEFENEHEIVCYIAQTKNGKTQMVELDMDMLQDIARRTMGFALDTYQGDCRKIT